MFKYTFHFVGEIWKKFSRAISPPFFDSLRLELHFTLLLSGNECRRIPSLYGALDNIALSRNCALFRCFFLVSFQKKKKTLEIFLLFLNFNVFSCRFIWIEISKCRYNCVKLDMSRRKYIHCRLLFYTRFCQRRNTIVVPTFLCLSKTEKLLKVVFRVVFVVAVLKLSQKK